MTTPKAFAQAAKASLAATLPGRVVKRGLVDPAHEGDDVLRQGLVTLITTERGDWTEYTGREGENGTLDFALVAYLRLDDDASPEQLQDAELDLEEELLAWFRLKKTAPLDAVYPGRSTYSGGLELPVGWVMVRAQALYI